MKTIRIFLASSADLEQERLVLPDLIENLNKRLERIALRIQLVKWEYTDSSMGPEHKQEDYNKELRTCDMCMVIFSSKFGMFTKAELDTAYHQLCEGKNPQKIYVYFKDGVELTDELRQFRDSFDENYGHFYCHYENVETLKAEFLLQFMEYQSTRLADSNIIEVKNGKVVIDGKEYVDLQNVPFARNHEKYHKLKQEIEDKKNYLQFIPKSNPLYAKTIEDLRQIKIELSKIETNIWNTALEVARLKNEKCSERLQKAITLFMQGDCVGAQDILNEKDIDDDVQYNLNLIELGKEGYNGIRQNINDYHFRVQMIKTKRDDGWQKQVINLHQKVILLCSDIFGLESKELAMEHDKYARTLCWDCHDFEAAEPEFFRSIEILKSMGLSKDSIYARVIGHLGQMYICQHKYLKAEPYFLEALEICEQDSMDDGTQYALALQGMGIFYRNIDCFDKAIDMFKEALSIVDKKEEKGLVHSRIRNSLALVYIHRIEPYAKSGFIFYEEAIKLLEESQAILASVLPKKDEDFIRTLYFLGVAHRKANKLKEAESSLLKAFELLAMNPGIEADYREMILEQIAKVYDDLGQREKAEQLGYDYHLHSQPRLYSGPSDKEREQKKKQIARRIAELYIKQNPRPEYYGVKLTSTEDDSQLEQYHHFSDNQLKLLGKFGNDDNDEYNSLEEFLEDAEEYDLIDKLLEHRTPFPLDTIDDIDLDHPLKFTKFSMQVKQRDGTMNYERSIGVPLSDEEYIDLLIDLLMASNKLSINQLVYKKSELTAKIIRHLANAYYDYQFELTDPFICDMMELKSVANSILDPFEDALHLFDTEDEDIRLFMLSHQIVPEGGVLYEEKQETYWFHCIMGFVGTQVRLFQEGIVLRWYLDRHDSDVFSFNARVAMDKFGIDTPEGLYPFLKEHFNTRDCLSRIREILMDD